MSIIKSFSVGDGDMFYIKHDTDNFTIIDCCLNDGGGERIVEELDRESSEKNVIGFISTHPDDDHIRGLEYLNKKIKPLNFSCVKNQTTKEDLTDDFHEYCSLRDNESFELYKDCSYLSDKENSIGIDILWPVHRNRFYKNALARAKRGESPNNISPIIKYFENDITALWMGDLETDFMESIEDVVDLCEVDILFAPHHGRKSGRVPKSWLDCLNPKVIVIGEAPSQNLHYYQHYNTLKQNSAGDILFMCKDGEADVYVSEESYDETFLCKDGFKSLERQLKELFGLEQLLYIGTIKKEQEEDPWWW